MVAYCTRAFRSSSNSISLIKYCNAQRSLLTSVKLGSNNRNKPEDGAVNTLVLQQDDIIVTATDGFFDNMFDPDILQLLNSQFTPDTEFKDIMKGTNIAKRLAEYLNTGPGAYTAVVHIRIPSIKTTYHLSALQRPKQAWWNTN